MKSKVFMCLFALASLMGYSQTNSLAKASSQSHFDLSILNAQNSSAPFSPIALETLENSTTPSLLPIDCGFSTPSNNFQDGIGYLQSDIIASDFKVQAGTTFSAQKLIFNVFQTKPTEKVEVSFYQNNNGKPGHLIARTAPLVPTSMTDLDIVNGSFVVRIEVDLPQAVALTAGDEATTYWVGLQVQNAGRTYWETTTIINSDFTYHTSYDGGSTWISGENLDNVFDLIGECYDNPEGCTESPNGQFPATVFTPACYGFTQLVAENASYGEYSTIEVTAGTQYIFKTNHDTDFITITDNLGNVVYRTGYGSAVWVATFSGNVRFYTHENNECSVSEELVNRYVQCGDLVFVLVPDFACFQGDGLVSITPENAFGTQGNERTADDFIVLTDEIFNVKQVRLNFASNSAISNSILNFYADNEGVPGQLLHSIEMQPTSQRIVNVYNSDKIYEATYTLPYPLSFEEGNYWLVPEVTNANNTNVAWEVSTYGNNGEKVRVSSDNGNTWQSHNYQAVFFIAGECLSTDAGCVENAQGMYPELDYTPICNGMKESITGGNNGLYSQYSVVNVTEGTRYIFSTDNPTAFITISNQDGNEILGAGYGSYVWIATYSGPIRYYTHLNENCEFNGYQGVDRFIQCGDELIITNPEYPCFQGDGISVNAPEYNSGVSAQGSFRTADDFVVEEGTSFTAKQFRMNIYAKDPILSVDFEIRKDENGLPGEILHSFTQAPTLVRVLSNGMMGMRIHELTVDFEQEMTFEAGKYWIVPIVHDQTESASLYWEATTDGFSGSFAAWSENEGQTWVENPIGMRMIFFVSGECEDMNVADPKIAEFDYYPNPTKDKLYMKSKSKIGKVSVYNSLGQLVINQTKIQQNQIDLSQLNAGVYLFRVLLENGQVETFKIVKL